MIARASRARAFSSSLLPPVCFSHSLARPLRVLFFGSDIFSVESLKALLENKRSAGAGKVVEEVEVVTVPLLVEKASKQVLLHVRARAFAEENNLTVHEAPPVEDKSWTQWCEVRGSEG